MAPWPLSIRNPYPAREILDESLTPSGRRSQPARWFTQAVPTTAQTVLGIALLGCGVAMLLTGVFSIVAKTSLGRNRDLLLAMGGCALLVLGRLVLPD
jgi:hypothetical protein